VRDLSVRYRRAGDWLAAVDDVSFSIGPGESVALAGESGSGKSTLAKALVGLVARHAGAISYDGHEMPRRTSRRKRPWLEIQMVFQEPGASLDPRMRIGAAIEEILKVHDLPASGSKAKRVAELLAAVGLPGEVATQLPSRLSGGQRQRVAIATALAVEPRLLICDEAVSALDVSIRAQILQLLSRLQDELGLAYLFITHDLAVAQSIAQRALIMYRGQIVEEAPTDQIFASPLHPYTQLLVASVPSLGRAWIPATVPEAANGSPPGCVFAPRCPYATEQSWTTQPQLAGNPA
jgi:oligopeptide/dipeptide ABC transporter ATP-binding protein